MIAQLQDELLSPEEVGLVLGGIAAKTLANWRSSNQGPEYIKVGRLVRYRRSAVTAFIESLDPTSNVSQFPMQKTG